MVYVFGPFQLDRRSETLFRGTDPMPVGKRAVKVLASLIEHAGIPVSKSALIDAAWAGLQVEESNLPVQVAALRKMLAVVPGGDMWIETMPRRGYRFVGPAVTSIDDSLHDRPHANAWTPALRTESAKDGRLDPTEAVPGRNERSRWTVGRDEALESFDRTVEAALANGPMIVFIPGEAGIGKSTFLELTEDRLVARGFRILNGRCVQRFGPDEAFVPLIEALNTRFQEKVEERFRNLAQVHASTWHLQIMDDLDDASANALRRQTFGATRERMIREFCRLVEALSADEPQALVVDDLHWSDPGTLDVLSSLVMARRHMPVLVIAAYRDAEIDESARAVRSLHRSLERYGRCAELCIARLTRSDVDRYLTLRFGQSPFPRTFVEAIFSRTQGQPLFLHALLDCLVDQGALVQTNGLWMVREGLTFEAVTVPDTVIRMIEFQIGRLSEQDQDLLEAASVSGTTFDAAAVAAGLGTEVLLVERSLRRLVERSVAIDLAGEAEWPDGTVSSRYGFRHNLYQKALYDRLSPGQRVALHQRVALRLESAYAGREDAIASALAHHFEEARDAWRAVQYLAIAGRASANRLGHREAAGFLSRALTLVEQSSSPEALKLRMSLLRQRSISRRSAGDLAGAMEDLRDMIDQADAVGETRLAVTGLLTLSRLSLYADRRICLQAANAVMAKSELLENDTFRVLAEGSTASINLYLNGWRESDAALCEKALAVTANSSDPSTLIRRYGIEGVFACSRSQYTAARTAALRGKQLAKDANDVYVFVLFNILEAVAHLHEGAWRDLRDTTQAALALAETNANLPAKVLCQLTLAWLHVEAMDFDGAQVLCESIDASVAARNPFVFMFCHAVLAKSYVGAKRLDLAKQQFDIVLDRLGRDKTGLDFTIATQLYYCLGDYCLEIGDVDKARLWAKTLSDYTSGAPDRNHLALAFELLARAAWLEGDVPQAEDQLARALETVGTDHFPLAQWRVHRAAMTIYESVGRRDKARAHGNAFGETLRTLSYNFPASDPLYRSLQFAAGGTTLSA